MPEKATRERAQEDKCQGKAASTQAGEFVREEIHHIREGKHGARSTKQAIAIGLSKARRAGVDLPPPEKGKTTERTRKSAERAYARGHGEPPKRPPSAKRSEAIHHALEREGTSAASHAALSRQAHAAARQRTAGERSAAAEKAAQTKGPKGRHAAAMKSVRTKGHAGLARGSQSSPNAGGKRLDLSRLFLACTAGWYGKSCQPEAQALRPVPPIPRLRFGLVWQAIPTRSASEVDAAQARSMPRKPGRCRASQVDAAIKECVLMSTINREELKAKMDRGDHFKLVEMVPEEDFVEAHLPGAIHLPPDRLRELAPRVLPQKRAEIVVCGSSADCDTAAKATRELAVMGYTNVKDYKGGKQDWINAGLPTQSEWDDPTPPP